MLQLPESILLSGFGPFGPHHSNPSGLIARALHNSRIGSFLIRGLELDVDWLLAERQLKAALIQHPQIRAVLLCGLADTNTIRIESRARNLAGGQPDNRGYCQSGRLDERGADSYSTNISIADLLAIQHSTSLPVCESSDAGAYLCNAAYYYIRNRHPGLPAVFIHLPARSEQELTVIVESALNIIAGLIAPQKAPGP
ncbi:MAG: hypothetical protein KDK39_10365 [Leptospiraceae bacterium]|nr:hypothetical protein [Leptospiraceae bacterium]